MQLGKLREHTFLVVPCALVAAAFSACTPADDDVSVSNGPITTPPLETIEGRVVAVDPPQPSCHEGTSSDLAALGDAYLLRTPAGEELSLVFSGANASQLVAPGNDVRAKGRREG